MINNQPQDKLIEAAKAGDTELLKELIKEGGDLFAYDDNDKQIVTYLAHAGLEENVMNDFLKFLAPYVYNRK